MTESNRAADDLEIRSVFARYAPSVDRLDWGCCRAPTTMMRLRIASVFGVRSMSSSGSGARLPTWNRPGAYRRPTGGFRECSGHGRDLLPGNPLERRGGRADDPGDSGSVCRPVRGPAWRLEDKPACGCVREGFRVEGCRGRVSRPRIGQGPHGPCLRLTVPSEVPESTVTLDEEPRFGDFRFGLGVWMIEARTLTIDIQCDRRGCCGRSRGGSFDGTQGSNIRCQANPGQTRNRKDLDYEGRGIGRLL